MKKFLLSLCLLNSFLLSSVASEVKFIQITDCHIKNDASYLKNTVEEINGLKDIDFVVFTGDNIDKVEPNSINLFLDTIKNLKVKTYVVIGNHDVFKTKGLDKLTYMKLTRQYLGFYHPDKPHYVFKKNDYIFVVLDGTKEIFPAPNGYFNEKELRWLDSTLDKYKDKKVVIIQHYPLLPSKDLSHNLWKIEEYIKVLKKHNNVISVVAGHYHINQEEKTGNIYHIITPAFEKGTYKIINIDDDLITTSLVQ